MTHSLDAIAQLLRYFPNLTAQQQQQFRQLEAIYRDWNAKINVISRKDMGNFYEHHVLHSLGIAKAIRFRAETHVMDAGTGGGFPGIPLAILFPDCRFHLIDSIGKKIRVAREVSEAIGLGNITLRHGNVVEEQEQFDFVVSRAVMPLSELVQKVRKNIHKQQRNALPNGLICLKGGYLEAELQPFRRKVETWQLCNFFSEGYFAEKQVVYLPLMS